MAAAPATEEFKQRVDRLKAILPHYYGVTVRREMPNINPRVVYNVLHSYTNNEAVLSILENLFNK